MNKWYLLLLTAAGMFGSALSAFALDAGGYLPALNPAPAQLLTTDGHKSVEKPDYQTVLLFDATSPDTIPYLRMLEALNDQYAELAEKKIRFTAVAGNALRTVREILAANPKISVNLFAEDSRKTFLELAGTEPVMPFAIVADQDNKVLWTGSPVELESVLNRILKGTFSYSTQLQVSRMRKDLQSAIQSSLPDVILNNADRILKILPGDIIAVQAKLFVYNSLRRDAEAMKFIRETVKLNSDNLNLRLLYLGLLCRAGNGENIRAELEKLFHDFKNSHESLLKIMIFSVENAPFGTLPLNALSDQAIRTADAMNQTRPEKKATALELLARVAGMTGHFAKAVEAQTQAMELRKGTPYEAAARERLDYYKTGKELSASPKFQGK